MRCWPIFRSRIASLLSPQTGLCATPQALKAILALVTISTAMAKFLSEPERIAIAEIMRDNADVIERQLERV
jgi:hypothetical protein